MRAQDINPFILSVTEFCISMLDSEVKVGKPKYPEINEKSRDMIGIIGMSGTAQGLVALKLPVDTALKMVGKMIGTKYDRVDSSIIDGVGEMVNIIAGGAKAKFHGHNITLSLPTVVRGCMYNISNIENAVFLSIPFETELGDFSLLITFKPVVLPTEEEVHAGTRSR